MALGVGPLFSSFVLVFWFVLDKVLLHSSGWPGHCHVDQVGLQDGGKPPAPGCWNYKCEVPGLRQNKTAWVCDFLLKAPATLLGPFWVGRGYR
jgi:hypothetical protein